MQWTFYCSLRPTKRRCQNKKEEAKSYCLQQTLSKDTGRLRYHSLYQQELLLPTPGNQSLSTIHLTIDTCFCRAEQPPLSTSLQGLVMAVGQTINVSVLLEESTLQMQLFQKSYVYLP